MMTRIFRSYSSMKKWDPFSYGIRNFGLPFRLLSCRHFDTLTDNFNAESCIKIEEKWKDKCNEYIKNQVPKNPNEKPFYVLSMFPYPSGQLHMGHVRVYTLSDAIARYHRMLGKKVIHPMGWDSFGLPAENAAFQNNLNPKEWTNNNIKSMREQMNLLGCYFDWEREISTCDPSYYKWTQFIFIKMFKNGLAYKKEDIVNWDPIDKTVLADEQVDEKGRSWRSGAIVEKRPLSQWFLRTTQFSKNLFDNLDSDVLINWRDIVDIQKHWIGKCDGTRIEFEIKSEDNKLDSLSLWTDKPELIFNSQFVGLSTEHVLNKEEFFESEFTSTNTKCQIKKLKLKAVNPFNGKEIPIYVIDNNQENSTKVFSQGTDSLLGIPQANELNKLLAEDFGLNEWESVLTEDGHLKNSGHFSGQSLEEAKESIMQFARNNNLGGYFTSSYLKDWLISRQRYWGTPIPIIHCKNCGAVPVPENQLPVELPDLSLLTSSGIGSGSPLENAHDWVNVTCPKCGEPGARRETDTMDTFVDSSWYFLRYLDSKNENELASTDAAKCLPVDIYIGGKEHATLHLYFARFFTHFLNKIGLSPVKEPFSKLLVQGLVKGKSFRVKGSNKYLRPDEVTQTKVKDPKSNKEKITFIETSSGNPLVVEWEKMSKSKFNGVSPKTVLDKYGSDTTRLMMFCDVGPSSERFWSEDAYPRIRNIQTRITKLVSIIGSLSKEDLPEIDDKLFTKERSQIWDARNFYLKTINHSYNLSHNLHFVIARIQSLLNELWRAPSQVKKDAPEFLKGLATSIIVLAPLAPHLSAELWHGLSKVESPHCRDEFLWDQPVFYQPWPKLDENYNLKLIVRQYNEPISTIPVAVWKFKSLTKQDAFDLTCHDPKVQENILSYNFEYQFSKFDDFEAYIDFKIEETPETIEARRKLKIQEKKDKKLRKEKRKELIAQKIKADEEKKIEKN